MAEADGADKKFLESMATDKFGRFLEKGPQRAQSPSKTFSDELQYQTEAEQFKRPRTKVRSKRPMKK